MSDEKELGRGEFTTAGPPNYPIYSGDSHDVHDVHNVTACPCGSPGAASVGLSVSASKSQRALMASWAEHGAIGCMCGRVLRIRNGALVFEGE